MEYFVQVLWEAKLEKVSLMVSDYKNPEKMQLHPSETRPLLLFH